MSKPVEPTDPLPQEDAADSGSKQDSDEGTLQLPNHKPIIRKVDESRHGDFWCD